MLFATTNLLANPVVVLSENKADYTQTSTGYIVHFQLQATAAELQSIEDLVAENPSVTMQVELVQEGTYNIVYTVDHQNQPEYVHKMMLSTGFQDVKYQGNDYDLNKVIEVIYFYQDQQ